MAGPIIELRGAARRYASGAGLQPIDLAVAAGRTTVLIGTSGCGKSTCLRLMIGLVAPDAGEVWVAGQRLTVENAPALRRRMGYVIQDGGLFPHLSAEGNVSLMARFLGWSEARVAARAAELCELTRFPASALAQFPSQLSGGQRQRVSLMRALFLDPEVLLLDEPLGALDPIIRSDLQTDLRTIVRRLRKSVVLVTHDLGEAGFLGDHLVLLRDGTIAQQGTLADLVRAPADPFVTRFVNAQRSPLEALAPP